MSTAEPLGFLLLGQPDLAEALMRALALKGELPSYSGNTFDPSVQVDDLTQYEYQYLRRMVRVMAGAGVSAVAAQVPFIGLVPTAGVNRALAVIERVIISNPHTAAVTATFGMTEPAIGISAPAAGTPHLPIDDRASRSDAFQYSPQFAISSGTNVGSVFPGGFGVAQVSLAPNASIVVEVGAVMTGRKNPATGAFSGFYVGHGTVNAPLLADFVWRERQILASEAL
jgi:hypothetical protein